MGDKPNVKEIPKDEAIKLKEAGITDDEIHVLSVYRHLHYGTMAVRKRDNRLAGRIEYRETF